MKYTVNLYKEFDDNNFVVYRNKERIEFKDGSFIPEDDLSVYTNEYKGINYGISVLLHNTTHNTLIVSWDDGNTLEVPKVVEESNMVSYQSYNTEGDKSLYKYIRKLDLDNKEPSFVFEVQDE